jgi:hypothetical protein
MSAARFEIRTTSAFDRMIRKLRPRRPELTDLYERAVNILEADLTMQADLTQSRNSQTLRLAMVSTESVLADSAFATTLKVRPST